ncbi:MAG: GNAT family N-acetyltransferase [Alphaproteobacteria bacterium]|nr:GNAT family N-acetyltransferase [Alphaproteobacteria bacterium]
MSASLVLASPIYAKSYVEALREGFRRGDQQPKRPAEIDRIEATFDEFFAELTKKTGNIVLSNGTLIRRVPSDVYWLVDGATFIGESGVRYRLNDWLLKIGGHVGYGIRPAFRRQGYGKLILKLALDILRDHGIKRALVTCYDHNVGSAKIIEANGGVLENLIDDPRGGGKSRRYWIDL